MKHLLLTTIAAVMVVGCGTTQQSVSPAEAKSVKPVAEVAKPEPPTAKAPDISIHSAASSGNIEAVKQHLAAGANVNAKDEDSKTPLLHAVVDGHKDVVELLIAKGADVNAKGGRGLTPLHFSAGFYSGLRGRGGVGKEMVELLIANGADVNAKDGRDYTPLDWAMSYPEIAELLRKLGGKTGEELKAAGN